MEMEPSRLAVLPARPPTPPKESNALPSSQDSDPIHAPQKNLNPGLHTPTDSPASINPASKSSERHSKRVGFRLGSSKLNNASSSSPDGSSSPKSNPNSRDMKPKKSILKPARMPEVKWDLEQGQPRDFPRMLEQVSQQLAGTDMSSRLDAYIALNNNLKTYKNGPEQRALVDKLPLFTFYVERDLQDTDTAATTPQSTHLAVEVVKLVSTLLWSPTMADELSEAFQLFVVNKSINVVGSDKVPKILVSQFLHLLAIQKFRARVLTTERIHRLLSFLKRIEDRVKGKQIVAHRLDIYKRLISQAPSIMSIRFRDWYEHIFHALMSSTKEIRARALSLGFEAGQALGDSELVTKSVSSLFSHLMEAEGTEERYGDRFAARLTEWLSSPEEARHVPQIWACVLMFLRHHPRPIERWTFIPTWLQIMKKCFNSTDNETRLQANRAWTRLIYAVDPCLTSGDSMIALLREPLRSQLDRAKGSDRDSARIRSSVTATYSTLLYYAFRPATTHDTYDRYWKACVAPFFSTPDERVTSLDVPTAADVLCSLLGDRASKSWSQRRAMEAPAIKPEEIPKLDSKWVRQRVSWVIPLVEAVLLDESWWQSQSDHPPSIRVWKCFAATLADAACKEIKVSPEAKTAVAEVISTLNRFALRSKSPAVFSRFAMLIDVASSSLGPLPFTEPKLTPASGKKDQFVELLPTQASREPGSGATAVTILLRLLIRTTPKNMDRPGLEESMRRVLELALRSASSRRTRLVVLRDACSKSFSDDGQAADDHSKLTLWQLVMQFVTDITSQADDALPERTQSANYDFHDVIKIFEHGLDLGAEPVWRTIEAVIVSQMSQSAPSVQVVESLAAFFLSQLQKSADQETMLAVTAFVEHVQWPQNRAGTNASSRRTLGLPSPNPKSASLDPYENLYGMMELLFTSLYKDATLVSQQAFVKVFDGAKGLVARIPRAALATSLNKLQPALVPWITDSEGRLNTQTEETTEIFKQVVATWKSIVERLRDLRKLNTSTLQLLNDLLVCSLGGRHRAIVNTTIEIWNRTFGTVEGLSYSEELRQILVSLGQYTEILTPGLSAEQRAETALVAMEYADTPANLAELSEDDTHVALPSSERGQKTAERIPLSEKSQNEQLISTPPRQRGIHEVQSTPRLRHDNSQIEFAEITSSPPNLEKIESQLLTERQREVRDRQQAVAAAMFPNLRSSPRAKSLERKQELPRLRLPAEQDLEQSDIDDTQSPTLPSPSGTPYLGSSPTPSQRRQSSKDKHNAATGSTVTTPASKPQAKEHGLEEMTSDASTLVSFGQTYGEELLALYEQPISSDGVETVDIMMPGDPSSEANQTYAEESADLQLSPRGETFVDQITQALAKEMAPSPTKLEAIGHVQERPRVDAVAAATTLLPSIEQLAQTMPGLSEADVFEVAVVIPLENSTQSQTDAAPQEPSSQSKKRKHTKSEKENKPQKRRRGRPKKSREQAWIEAAGDDMEDCIIVAAKTRDPVEEPSSQLTSSTLASEAAMSPASEPKTPKKSKKKRRHEESSVSEETSQAEASPKKKAKKANESESLVQAEEVAAVRAEEAAPEAPTASDAAHEEVVPALAVATTQTTPSRARTTSGAEFLAKVRQLLGDARDLDLGEHGDEIMSGLMDLGKQVMAAKRRD